MFISRFLKYLILRLQALTYINVRSRFFKYFILRLKALTYIMFRSRFFKYRMSQKTWEFSDEFDVVFLNNS